MAKPVLGSDPLARLKARSPELLPLSTAPAEAGAPPARPTPPPPGSGAPPRPKRKKPEVSRAVGARADFNAGSGTKRVNDLDGRVRAFERGLEQRLARFEAGLSEALQPGADLDPTAERRMQEAMGRVEEKIGRLSTMVEELEEEERQGLLESVIALGDAVQRAISFDTYRRYFNNLGMRDHRFEVDEFGLESDARDALLPYVRFLFQRWWRVKVEGVENLPFEGPGLIVANHSGVLPYDGVMIAYAIEHLHPAQRKARFLADDWVATLPFASSLIRRLGGVRGCRENAERLLRKGELVAVFPEGVKGIGKYFHERYRLQRFGRGGFVQIAMRTGAPIVPVAVIGAEETHPILYKVNWLANALRTPFFPVSPTWPLLGPLGLMPLPSKWQIVYGEPIPFDGYSPEDTENDFLVNQLKEKVRAVIQEMIDEHLKERRSVWFG